MAGAGDKPHGLKHYKTEDHFAPADRKHHDFHTGQTSDGNQTPGNADSEKKKFTKAHPLVNPAHKGYCTPMSKETCTPRRKAFAKRVKREHGFH